MPLPATPPVPAFQVQTVAMPATAACPDLSGRLAGFVFGRQRPADAGNDVHVALETDGRPWREYWQCAGSVSAGPAPLQHCCGSVAFGLLSIDEPHGTDIETAARDAYAQLREHLASSDYPHLLRIWNYLDAVTEGDGDAERYRRFCVGRVAGMGSLVGEAWPAATCIGRHDGVRRLQVYWLASRHPGLPLENPRQVSAWRYPRQYGPQSPTFARALLPDARDGLPLLISGTASIVGHASLHHGDVQAQLEETLANVQALIDVARQHRPDLPAQLDAGSPLKVYVRHREDLPRVAARLDALLPDGVPRLLLHGEICRAELLVEIEAMHGPVPAMA